MNSQKEAFGSLSHLKLIVMAVLDRYDNINGYTVLDLIKSNVHTETYRVEDTDGKHYFLKLFAIKELPTAMINAKTGTVYEIEYSKSINHRNIIRAIADGRFDNDRGSYQYYITSYFNGQILADKHGIPDRRGDSVLLTQWQGRVDKYYEDKKIMESK